MEAKSIRVVCVDDHPLILAGIKAILDAEPDVRYVGGATSGEEGLQQIRAQLPDVALIDLRLPDMAGTAVISSMRRDHPSVRAIALTTFKGDAQIRQALLAGATGYLLKDVLHQDLVDVIKKVYAGGRALAPAAVRELADHLPQTQLSAREVEIIHLMADGKRNKEISEDLGVAEDTIKFHVKNVLCKLGVHDRAHAVTLAIKRGILRID